MSRVAVVRRCRGQCGLCGLPIVTYAGDWWRASLDHIVPLSRGGLHQEDNVQLAHRICNSIKGDDRPGWKGRMVRRIRLDSPFATWFLPEARCG